MHYLGMFCLGAFVSALLTYGLHFIKDWSDFAKAATTIIASTLSGVVFHFIQYMGGELKQGLYAYPIGLLLALMWYYTNVAVANINSENRSRKLLGWGHILGVVLLSAVAAALVLPPAFRETWG